jgi:hypothetical protein
MPVPNKTEFIKKAAEEEVKVAEPVAATESVAAEPAAAEPVAAAEPAVEKKARTQVSSILHLSISHARVNTILRGQLNDKASIDALDAAREKKKAAAPEELAAAEAEVKEASKAVIRVSNDTPVAVATLLDIATKELIKGAIESAEGKSTIEVKHLHAGEPQKCVLFPLYEKTPTWAGYVPEVPAPKKSKKTAAAAAAEPAAEPVAAEPVAAEPAAEAEESEEVPKGPAADFYTYVDAAVKNVKASCEKYNKVRVSRAFRTYLSLVLSETIGNISKISRIIVNNIAGARTLNVDHVKAIVGILLTNAGTDDFAAVLAAVDEKTVAFRNHVAIEKKDDSAEPAAAEPVA